jgi:hypothetical protein
VVRAAVEYMAALVAVMRVVIAASAAAVAAALASGTRITIMNLVCMKHAPVEHKHDFVRVTVHSLLCAERPLASRRLPVATGHAVTPVLSHGLPVAVSVGVTCTKLSEKPSAAAMSAVMRGAAIFA